MSDLPKIVIDFRNRINDERLALGLKHKPFAENELKINYQTYRNFMGFDKKRPAKQGPSLETIGELITQVGVKKVWQYLTGESPPTRQAEPPTLIVQTTNHFRPVENAIEQGRYIPVRLLADRAAAGPPSEINESDVEGWALIYADREWMPHSPENYTCIRVRGDSMFPVLADGDLVAIDHAMKPTNEANLSYLEGKMCAFRVDGGVTIKWFKYISKEQAVVGIPENRNELEHIVVLRKDDIYEGVIGMVRWWWSKR